MFFGDLLQEVDAYDLSDPVDITPELRGWDEEVAATVKWSLRRDLLTKLKTLAGRVSFLRAWRAAQPCCLQADLIDSLGSVPGLCSCVLRWMWARRSQDVEIGV